MSTPNLLDAVRVVKENERRASESYADAARQVKDKMAQKLFEMLSEFEQFHYAQLTTLEKSLVEKGNFLNADGKAFPLPPLFEIKAAEEPNEKSLMGIISAAMELEKQAEQTYADLAALVTDSQGRELFRGLSEQEHTHYRILRDAYWALSQQILPLR
jgi:rubrerythrin